MALGTIALFLLILIPLRTLFLIGALDPSQERVSTALVEAEAVADRVAGTDWSLLGEVAGMKIGSATIAARPSDVQHHLWVGFGRRVYATLEQDSWADAVALAGAEHAARVWEGIGIGWLESLRFDQTPQYLQTLDEPARSGVRAGLARPVASAGKPCSCRVRGSEREPVGRGATRSRSAFTATSAPGSAPLVWHPKLAPGAPCLDDT